MVGKTIKEIDRRKFLKHAVLGATLAITEGCLKSPEIKTRTRFFKGVDTMKLSKDRLKNPLSFEDKMRLVEMAKGLGIGYVTIDTPYDSPPGTDAVNETREWVEVIKFNKLHSAHRHMFTAFEGIYGQKRDPTIDYPEAMKSWMIKNSDLISDGDIWTPMPEPQNGGISGVNCDKECFFKDEGEFNDFLRKITRVSKETLTCLKKKDVEVVCCGMDLFLASGNNNPQYEGNSFLEKETLDTLGCVGFDHYPQPDYKTELRRNYRLDLDQLSNALPENCFVLTEVGRQEKNKDTESVESMFATFEYFSKKGLRGVFWWHLDNAGTDEGLLNPDFTPREAYFKVRDGFAKLPDYVYGK